MVGETEVAAKLCAEIRKYDPPRHGIIEALAGEPIMWPPYPEEQYVVGPDPSQRTSTHPNVCSNPEDAPWQVICHEIRNAQMAPFDDWEEYADLALYRALDLYNEGNLTESRSIYREVMESFDGIGFKDKVFDIEHTYATYKLALAIYVGSRIGEPVDKRIVKVLLDKQQRPGSSHPLPGGFIALYDAEGGPLNDTNTETTAYALLALSSLQPDYDVTFACSIAADQ
jgi:hypothetical protein